MILMNRIPGIVRNGNSCNTSSDFESGQDPNPNMHAASNFAVKWTAKESRFGQ